MINFINFNYDEKNFSNAISNTTINFHYNKHLKAYVDKTNELIANTLFSSMSLEEIILSTFNKPEYTTLYNNAGQVYNHNIYFTSFGFGTNLDNSLKSEIIQTFGTIENLKSQLINSSINIFGSGWCWLVRDNQNALKIITTTNANTPLTLGLSPIFNIDVWEHAYYLDYQNLRKSYVTNFIDNVLKL